MQQSPVVTISYPVTIDYRIPLGKMVRQAQFDMVESFLINGKDFPHGQRGVEHISIGLAPFNSGEESYFLAQYFQVHDDGSTTSKKISYNEICQYLSEQNLQPITLAQLCSLVAALPDLYEVYETLGKGEDFFIHAFGSSLCNKQGTGSIYTPCAKFGSESKDLGLLNFDADPQDLFNDYIAVIIGDTPTATT